MQFKFPRIRQFREVTKEFRKLGINDPVEIIGIPKVHGRNANILFEHSGEFTLHNKEEPIDKDDPAQGFVEWANAHKSTLVYFAEYLLIKCPGLGFPFVISGEWAGGNVQGSASTNGVENFFAFIAVGNVVREIDDQGIVGNHIQFLPLTHNPIDPLVRHIRLYDVRLFGEHRLTYDPRFPELIQNQLADLTLAIEADCPVSKYFGVTSDRGEGLVWHCATNADRHLYFKVKGQKHSVARVSQIGRVNPEKINNINQFVEYACTENRMEQGFKETGPNPKMGDFLSWLNRDIIKEETDVLEENGLEYKTVSKFINSKAMAWYKHKVNV